MTLEALDILAVALSYLLGCVPTGLWLGKAVTRIDIREHGSKNIGATNTVRVLGKKLGFTALAGDVLKGLVAVVLFARLGTAPYLPLACGIAAILGHVFPVFLRFKGGKGVATSTGVYLGLVPIPTLIALAVFFVVFRLSRMVSAGSLTAAVVLAALVFVPVFDVSVPLQIITVAVALFIVYLHRTNIQRIVQGVENRF